MCSSLDEIYTFQAQLRACLRQGAWSEINHALASARQRMAINPKARAFAYLCTPGFLFPPGLLSNSEIHRILLRWHAACPTEPWPCLLLAENGLAIAENAPDDPANIEVGSALFFWWAAKAIARDGGCLSIYLRLLSYSGVFREPMGLRQGAVPLHFWRASLSPAAQAALVALGGAPDDNETVLTHLPPANQQEQTFPPGYWFNRALACAPDSLAARETWLGILMRYHRGEARQQAIDDFISGGLCQALTARERNVLVYAKHAERLYNPAFWPRSDQTQALMDWDNHFYSLLSLDLPPRERIMACIAWANVCERFLFDEQGACYRLSTHFARRIYDCMDTVLACDDVWLLFSLSSIIFHHLSRVLAYDLFRLRDTKGLLPRYIALNKARGDGIQIAMVGVIAAQVPFAGLSLPGEGAERMAHLLRLATPDNIAVFRSAGTNLLLLGYGVQVKQLLCTLAERGGHSAALLLGEWLTEHHWTAEKTMGLGIPSRQVEIWLQAASDDGVTEATFLLSRLLEKRLAQEHNISRRSALTARREALLKQAIAGGHAMAQYDYACALALSDEPDKIKEGLEIVCAAVLISGRIADEYRGYIAWIYAFSACHGRGMEKNLVLVDYWSRRAIAWGKNCPWYRVFHAIATRFPFSLWYKRRLVKHAARIPSWQQALMQQLN